jgi:hypothetical protein
MAVMNFRRQGMSSSHVRYLLLSIVTSLARRLLVYSLNDIVDTLLKDRGSIVEVDEVG